MGFWERHVVPRLVERTCGMKDLEPLRAELCGGLSGRVIELGFGSGFNAKHYPASVVSVDAVEPSELGWKLSAERRSRAEVPIARVGLDAQRVEADDAAYHCALSTFTLCTIPDAATALEEVRRVLLPGGSLYFLEHGRAPTDRVRRWQRRMEPLQKRLAGGCHLTRDIPALVRAAGLEVVELAEDYLPGPGPSHPWGYVYRGRAVKPTLVE